MKGASFKGRSTLGAAAGFGITASGKNAGATTTAAAQNNTSSNAFGFAPSPFIIQGKSKSELELQSAFGGSNKAMEFRRDNVFTPQQQQQQQPISKQTMMVGGAIVRTINANSGGGGGGSAAAQQRGESNGGGRNNFQSGQQQQQPFLTLNDFQIQSKLGQGASGEVHLVVHRITGQIFALKQVKLAAPQAVSSEHAAAIARLDRESAIREVRTNESLDCPYVVRYHAAFFENDRLNIVMEHMEKGTLSSIIREHCLSKESMSETVVWRYFISIAIGLCYLHNRGIIHRDVKASNVLVSGANVAKVSDLGLAAQGNSISGRLRTGRLGTICYMSPEIVDEKPYDGRCDIWALGIIAYECCTLKTPFPARDIQSLKRKHKRFAETGLPPISSSYGADLQDLVFWCMTVDPAARPTSRDILLHPAVFRKAESLHLTIPVECRIGSGASSSSSNNINGNSIEGRRMRPQSAHVSSSSSSSSRPSSFAVATDGFNFSANNNGGGGTLSVTGGSALSSNGNPAPPMKPRPHSANPAGSRHRVVLAAAQAAAAANFSAGILKSSNGATQRISPTSINNFVDADRDIEEGNEEEDEDERQEFDNDSDEEDDSSSSPVPARQVYSGGNPLANFSSASSRGIRENIVAAAGNPPVRPSSAVRDSQRNSLLFNNSSVSPLLAISSQSTVSGTGVGANGRANRPTSAQQQQQYRSMTTTTTSSNKGGYGDEDGFDDFVQVDEGEDEETDRAFLLAAAASMGLKREESVRGAGRRAALSRSNGGSRAAAAKQQNALFSSSSEKPQENVYAAVANTLNALNENRDARINNNTSSSEKPQMTLWKAEEHQVNAPVVTTTPAAAVAASVTGAESEESEEISPSNAGWRASVNRSEQRKQGGNSSSSSLSFAAPFKRTNSNERLDEIFGKSEPNQHPVILAATTTTTAARPTSATRSSSATSLTLSPPRSGTAPAPAATSSSSTTSFGKSRHIPSESFLRPEFRNSSSGKLDSAAATTSPPRGNKAEEAVRVTKSRLNEAIVYKRAEKQRTVSMGTNTLSDDDDDYDSSPKERKDDNDEDDEEAAFNDDADAEAVEEFPPSERRRRQMEQQRFKEDQQLDQRDKNRASFLASRAMKVRNGGSAAPLGGVFVDDNDRGLQQKGLSLASAWGDSDIGGWNSRDGDDSMFDITMALRKTNSPKIEGDGGYLGAKKQSPIKKKHHRPQSASSAGAAATASQEPQRERPHSAVLSKRKSDSNVLAAAPSTEMGIENVSKQNTANPPAAPPVSKDGPKFSSSSYSIVSAAAGGAAAGGGASSTVLSSTSASLKLRENAEMRLQDNILDALAGMDGDDDDDDGGGFGTKSAEIGTQKKTKKLKKKKKSTTNSGSAAATSTFSIPKAPSRKERLQASENLKRAGQQRKLQQALKKILTQTARDEMTVSEKQLGTLLVLQLGVPFKKLGLEWEDLNSFFLAHPSLYRVEQGKVSLF